MTNVPQPRGMVSWTLDRNLYYWERVPPCSYEYLCQLFPEHVRRWLARNTNVTVEEAHQEAQSHSMTRQSNPYYRGVHS
eukprot:10761935-Prorocentrum_lima.AAC.1